jgi:tetratricopeptide (TPR) repeat protein
VVQSQLAEIEYIAGRFDRADAAADRALALQPKLVEALVRKGLIAMRRASEAKPADAKLWAAARAWYLKANRADPNAVMPLYLYYASFVAAKEAPSASAVNALMRAVVLAPESREIRYALARQKLLEHTAVDARALLQPIAFAPHLRRKRNIPREMVDLIDAGKMDEAIALMTQDEKEDED